MDNSYNVLSNDYQRRLRERLGETPECVACYQPIEVETPVMDDGGPYHPECFELGLRIEAQREAMKCCPGKVKHDPDCVPCRFCFAGTRRYRGDVPICSDCQQNQAVDDYQRARSARAFNGGR